MFTMPGLSDLLLHHVPGLGPKRLRVAQQFFSQADQLLSQNADFWRGQIQLPPLGWEMLLDWQKRGQHSTLHQAAYRDLCWVEEAETHHILSPAHPHYPASLKVLHDPPNLLYVQGNPTLLSQPQIAVVGARSATRSGLALAHRFAQELSAAGWLVTSGLALGVDGAAHQGCLDAGFPTLAVLGSGLQRIYPVAHQSMASVIAESGALISEFPIAIAPKPYHFPQRNRIIAGLCHGLLVVEAAEKSGSLITAQMALEAGKEVFAVPGNISNPWTQGCHRLIQQGAGLVMQTADILDAMPERTRPITPLAVGRPEKPVQDVASVDTPLHAAVLSQVDYDGMSVDELVLATGLSPDVLMPLLLWLELAGAIISQPGGYCRVGPVSL